MKRKMHFLAVLIVQLLFCSFLFAQEEEGSEEKKDLGKVVVTATKTEVSIDKVTKSVNVVTKEEMEATKEAYLPEVLDNLPGVFVRRTGGVGQFTNVGIRGLSSSYTQFQYNGIPLNDVADTQGAASYFIEDMYMSSSVDQVEVLKGTGSSLYGSRAIGGVINIIPGKPKKGLHFESSTEYGGEDQLTQKARVSYGGENFYLDFCPTIVKADGYQTDNGYTGYYYDNKGFSARAGVELGKIKIDIASLNYFTDLGLGDSASVDGNGDLVRPEPTEDKHREGIMSSTGLTLSHDVSEFMNYQVKGAYTKTQRHYIWDADSSGDESHYDGEDYYADVMFNFNLGEMIILSAGTDGRFQKYNGQEPTDRYGGDWTPGTGDEDYTPHKQEEDYYTNDVYAMVQLSFLEDTILANIGARYVMPSEFDNQLVYDASVAVNSKNTGTKVHGGVSTGYRLPSLYELYGGYLSSGSFVVIGNEDLEPEKSITYEAGVEQSLLNIVKAGVTVFHTEFEDRIIYASGYDQAGGESYSQGYEAFLNVLIGSYAKFDAAYTFIKSEYKDDSSDDFQETTYLPNHKFTATLTILPIANFTGFVRATYRSSMNFDIYGHGEYGEDEVLTFDANVGYKVNDNADVWVRVENLLDEDYTEGGYFMPGRQIYAGMKLAI